MNKKRILIVDDQKEIFLLLKSMLQCSQYEIYYADSAEKAYRKYSSFPYDVVLTDINMPAVSGLDLLQKLKKQDPDVMVIMFTGSSDMEKAKKAIKFGAFDYINKPVKKKELQESVDKALTKGSELKINRKHQLELEITVDERTEILKIQKEALQREQERTRGIIEEAHIGFLVIDGFSEEVFLLNKLGKMFLKLLDEVQESYFFKNYQEIFPVNVVKILSTIIEKIKSEKQAISFGDYNIDENLVLNIVAYPIMMETTISSIVIAVENVTEKKLLEKQILQTSRLADIGQLAAVVAHEINNPVAFVDSNTHSLKKYLKKMLSFCEKVDALEIFLNNFNINEDMILDVYQDVLSINDVIQKHTKELHDLKKELKIDKALNNMKDIISENLDGLDRIKKIVSDLKTFSYMGEEKPEEVDINEILDETIKLIWNKIKYKLDIIKKYNQAPKLRCLPRQLSQVFSNIIINASHAVANKGAVVIETSHVKSNISIAITDNGSGMDEKTIKKIFDPFYTSKKINKGTGLGLSISLKIITKHNGTIRVKSKKGEGTTFFIDLPLDGINEGINNS